MFANPPAATAFTEIFQNFGSLRRKSANQIAQPIIYRQIFFSAGHILYSRDKVSVDALLLFLSLRITQILPIIKK